MKLFRMLFDEEGEKSEESKGSEEKTFTQEQVNSINKKEREKRETAEASLVETQKIMESLKNQSTMSAEESKKLNEKIEELETKNLSSEQKAARALENAQKKTEEEINTLKEQGKVWQERFSKQRVETDILKASEGGEKKAKALNPNQLIDLLAHRVTLEPVKDDEGNETGEFNSTIPDFRDTDKDGKELKVKMTIIEAIDRMREMEEYANLFANEKVGGLGIFGNKNKSKKTTDEQIEKMSGDEYIEARKEGKVKL